MPKFQYRPGGAIDSLQYVWHEKQWCRIASEVLAAVAGQQQRNDVLLFEYPHGDIVRESLSLPETVRMKELLLTPGPTTIPSEVNEALLNSNIHHRTPEFEAAFAETLDKYAALIDSPTRPIALAGTGTAAMDATLQNICRPGDAILVLEAGKFGERWLEIAETLELSVTHFHAEWGGTFAIDEVRHALTQKKFVAVCCQYCETSTTALHPVATIGHIIREVAPDALFVVDGITAVGVKPISQQKSEIDVLICGSQKALMLPPGLALISMSERAWRRVEERAASVYYFNLLQERKAHAKNTTAYTPAISLILGLHAALTRMEHEGLENVFERHAQMAALTRRGLAALGFRLLAEDCPAPGVTGGYPPEGYAEGEIRAHVIKHAAIRLAGGQGHLKSAILRFGHMGATTIEEVTRGLLAIEAALVDMGASQLRGTIEGLK